MKLTPREVLADNVRRLMIERYGAVNKSRLARELAPPGRPPMTGSVQRLLGDTTHKAGSANIGLDLLEKVAHVFNLAPWQMLCPHLNVKRPQKLIDADQLAKYEYAALLFGAARPKTE